MRLKSSIWITAYLRRLYAEGLSGVVARRGAEEAGVIFIKVNRLDGTAELYGPAPQASFDEARPESRLWTPLLAHPPVPEAEVDARLQRELRFDSDAWIVEIDTRSGEHLLELSAD